LSSPIPQEVKGRGRGSDQLPPPCVRWFLEIMLESLEPRCIAGGGRRRWQANDRSKAVGGTPHHCRDILAIPEYGGDHQWEDRKRVGNEMLGDQMPPHMR
jgi:hypothetical protein